MYGLCVNVCVSVRASTLLSPVHVHHKNKWPLSCKHTHEHTRQPLCYIVMHHLCNNCNKNGKTNVISPLFYVSS